MDSRGDAIPRIARIFSVVDVFDALTSERPYKKPMPLAEALTIIGGDSGRQFDPAVLETSS
jgi:putative two-component system response regulator